MILQFGTDRYQRWRNKEMIRRSLARSRPRQILAQSHQCITMQCFCSPYGKGKFEEIM